MANTLYQDLTRLAHAVPATRPHLVPLLRKYAGSGAYNSLADAAAVTGNPAYGSGRTQVWFMKPSMYRDLSMGTEWLEKQGIPLPDPRRLQTTHVLLGTVAETNPDKIFYMMQSEVWSPDGEAQNLTRRLGLHHTSMSVGDVIRIGNQALMVDRLGFHKFGMPSRSRPKVEVK